MARTILSLHGTSEHDVVAARQYARQISAALGFESQDQTRIATAVSEIARNACRYAKDGTVEFSIEGERAPQLLLVRVRDSGPGIPHLDEVLNGRYRSNTGMGMGITGARRLMDQCDVRTGKDGTEVLLKKMLPPKASVFGAERIDALAKAIAGKSASNPFEEIQQQNRELVRALTELRERQDELAQLNGELEDTNRGVVALYAELDEKADHLRRADEMKSRFLSNMSHEFRTPLNSIRALSKIVLDRIDGELTGEQEKQMGFIQKAADDLKELVDDLLDIAKIEAGKIELRPIEFSAANLFSALRGMLRPLLVGDTVNLRFAEPSDVPDLFTDEAKVSQVIRNFISNALKFTEQGEILVSCSHDRESDLVTFSVADTGIGIRAEDQARVFEEFIQINNPLQTRAKGTGLGLPLCKKLAELLGGVVSLHSEFGKGSTFSMSIPAHVTGESDAPATDAPAPALSALKIPVLVVEDDEAVQLYYSKILRDTCYEIVPARNLRDARRIVKSLRPAAIVLDIVLRGEDSWQWLGELKSDAATQAVPVIMISTVNDEGKGLALGASACIDKPVERRQLIAKLDELTRSRVLVIDDEASLRYAMKRILERTYVVMEAESGKGGLLAAATMAPSLIVLDLGLPDIRGEEILLRLRDDPATRDIPVLVATSRSLSATETETLQASARGVMSKFDINENLLAQVALAVSPHMGAAP
jgi:signal transduction histidine kinase/DNA-binding response OmpR family regulator